jgi:predicted phage terminase large subunit-like protein
MSEALSFGPCSEKQRLVLLDDSTDILLTGGGAGSGKSYTCLTKALKYINDPSARVMIVRRSYPMLKLSGGLVDESKDIYSHFGGVFGVQALTWKFPNGATVQFAALPDKLEEWQGLQASHILVDEGAEFKENEILFLMSRLRSAKYKGHLNMTITCNPSRDSFLFNWVEFCLDPETGIPKAGTEHITRYFVNIGGKMFWSESKEELTKTYGQASKPLSFRFVPMTIVDNPILLKNNPTYLSNLLSQPRVNQLRFLSGSWTARAEGASYFNRDWVEIVDYPPVNPMACVRSWDLAASVPSESNNSPDWSAGVKMSRDSLGTYYIEHVERFQKLTDGVLKTIIEVADRDGKAECTVTIPRDAGAGGKTANAFYVRKLAENGIAAKSVVMSGHSGKIQRFLPFCALAESGAVKIVRGSWNEDYLTELEFFTGSRNLKDDQVDATADGFNTLSRQIQLPTFALPNMDQASPIPSI